MRVNYVYSGKLSKIFSDIYFKYKKLSEYYNIKLVKSSEPITNADVYHYHRPNKCQIKEENSVLTMHFDIDDPYQKICSEELLCNIKRCKAVICLNKKDLLRISTYNSNTFLIRHGIDNNQYWSSRKIIKKKVTIGVVSKRYSDGRKGERYLLRLARHLDKYKYDFIFIGEGWGQIVWSLKLKGFRVKFYKEIEYKYIGSIYQQINILYIGSLYEAGPANVQEAIKSGTYLLSHPVGAAADFILDGVSGKFLVFDLDMDLSSIEKLSIRVKNKLSPLYDIQPISWKENFEKQVKLYRSIANRDIANGKI